MIIGREEISALLPHAGAMCLLDGVVRWDQASIRCVSGRHRAADNPLRRPDGLAAICGIEFAAQAMAVHGRLAAEVDAAPRAGYLASLRDVVCSEARLDLLEGELVIDAERLMGDERQAIYRFAVGCAGRDIVSGRAAVLLDVGAP